MNSTKPLPSSNNAEFRISYEAENIRVKLPSLSIDYLAACLLNINST